MDTEVDQEEEPRAPQKRRCPMRPEKGMWTRRQAPEEGQMPQAPQALPPPSCPLLALLAKDPEPWTKARREEPDAGILRSLAREVAEAKALDANILEALNEAAETELDDAWNRASAAVSHKGLPIVFDFVEEERLFELALVEGAPAFYVGATQDPLRRWVGDPYGDEQRGAMPGHREAGWNEMRVVHVAHGGAAASLEARLIREAMELHPSHCRNAVPDARGLSRRAINFVYILV